jgi:hypothetical protein
MRKFNLPALGSMLLLLSLTLVAWGQVLPAPPEGLQLRQSPSGLEPPVPPPNPSSGGNLINFFSSNKTPYEFWLTCLIIAFGLAVLTMLFLGLRRLPADRRPEDYTRSVMVITVITASLILITAGYSDRQAAPAFGLFGTIVGYILGRMGRPGSPDSEPAPQPTNPLQRANSAQHPTQPSEAHPPPRNLGKVDDSGRQP